MTLTEFRKEYALSGLRRRDLHLDPLQQFQSWFNDAVKAEVAEPTAMTIATANKQGQPSARTVLLKCVDERGFVFCTNYDSRKGGEIAENALVSLVFHWRELERQVCISGSTTKTPKAESDAYFNARPAASRIGALASNQSSVVKSRVELEQEYQQIAARFPDENIPRPSNWGGYVIAPTTIEFWQGRLNRLHDRFRYTKQNNGLWIIERLAP